MSETRKRVAKKSFIQQMEEAEEQAAASIETRGRKRTNENKSRMGPAPVETTTEHTETVDAANALTALSVTNETTVHSKEPPLARLIPVHLIPKDCSVLGSHDPVVTIRPAVGTTLIGITLLIESAVLRAGDRLGPIFGEGSLASF
jgi:hypothetical protein